MAEAKKIGKTDDYVYDISLDGSVIDALTLMVASNTDGMNMKMPDTFRYTEEHPYIGKGLNRDVKEGEKYIGVVADIMEFDDLFMRKKMGLGLDEFALATINLSRKNYMDYLEDGTTKKVGNTIKFKKMPTYIEKFIDASADLLLFNKGKEFLDSYYDYIEKIYNFQIPLREIASKGKIKKTLKQYIEDCKTITKAGTKKPRQAWYELLLLEKNPYVEIGDTIYYINTGKKKGDSDIKRITQYYQNTSDGKKDITKELNSAFNKYKSICKKLLSDIKNVSESDKANFLFYNEEKKRYEPHYTKLEVLTENGTERSYIYSKLCKDIFGNEKIYSEDIMKMNCVLLDKKIVESEEDTFCDENIEYNVTKYIEQFNKRIKPLLICFSKSIRDKILITNPDERKYFTDEESKLTNGEPNKPTDQDTYEELMTMDRREVAFWTRIGEVPPFVKECGMNWEEIQKKYYEQLEKENNEKFKELDRKYEEALNSLTVEDVDEFYSDAKIPTCLDKIVMIKEDSNELKFYFRELPNMTPSSGGYIFDEISYNRVNKDNSDEIEEAVIDSNNNG